MNNTKIKPVNISLTKDTEHIINDLDVILNDIGISRSQWFRGQVIRYIKRYKSFDEEMYKWLVKPFILIV